MANSSIYDHHLVEQNLYKFWKENHFFEPIPFKKGLKNYSIILPPPNVTGKLHLGHAWDGSLQDTIIRYKKLQGFRTIWIPGADHAGIATQTKFERILKEQGIDRKLMSDKKFLNELMSWSIEQKNNIHQQWAKMGFALSYNHETYTLDKNVATLVNKTFQSLYSDGLIYQSNKLVNWDVELQTAISDLEVIYKTARSKMYYFKYYIEGSDQFLEIATTRPETMFVDVGLFVNPKDKRYQKYIGKNVINPINNKPIKIYSDSYVDMNFGTGVMKCTPAHDFNDYQLAKKYKIKNFMSVMNLDGSLNDLARDAEENFEGLDRLDARTKIVQNMSKHNLLLRIEEHENKIGYSERSGAIVEPLLSLQWYVKMQALVTKTIKLMQKQKPKFIPSRFEKVMTTWLNNVEDWCISRQLLWGHRIPIWYHKNNSKKMIVGEKPNDIQNWIQDNNVLDTWFSSGLWPIALTLYAKDESLKDFYPIEMLVTGYDIIFFWVARMFFQCVKNTNTIPFRNVLIHGLVRDEQNRKMSKTLSNGIDPLDIIEKYGADALHLFLITTTTMGEDLRFSTEKVQHCWAFINKLWNAHNFIKQFNEKTINSKIKHPINAWIVNKFNLALKIIAQNMDDYNFVVAYKYLQTFVWEIFCNKYLEYIKQLLNDATYQNETILVTKSIFNNILIMLHPFIPFVTERIYQNLYHIEKSIMLAKWPTSFPDIKYDDKLISTFIDIHSCIRDLRIKDGIKHSNLIEIDIISKKPIIISTLNELLSKFNIHIKSIIKQASNNMTIVNCDSVTIAYQSFNNETEAKKKKLIKEIEHLKNEVQRSHSILSNRSFLANAPKEKIEIERQKLENYQELLSKTQKIYQETIKKA